jgi:large subunit ribosomal protein L29
MKVKELHAMSMTDLQKQLKNSRQELFNLRFQMATGQLANHRQIRHVRNSLAQILTEIHMKERDSGDGGGAAVAVAEAPKPRRRRAPAEEKK